MAVRRNAKGQFSRSGQRTASGKRRNPLFKPEEAGNGSRVYGGLLYRGGSSATTREALIRKSTGKRLSKAETQAYRKARRDHKRAFSGLFG